MAAMSDYLENKLIDHIFRATAFTAPATIYIGLHTAAPSDTGGGTEVSGNAYARVAVVSGTTAWNATQGGTAGASSGTDGTTENASAITFPTPTWLYRTARVGAELVRRWPFHDERPLSFEEVQAQMGRWGEPLAVDLIWPIVFTQGLCLYRRRTLVDAGQAGIKRTT